MKEMKIACLGPSGSYSELAARQLDPAAERLLCTDFYEVMERLTSREVDRAVLPVENSIQGGVWRSLDLLERNSVFADREYVLPIDHRFAVREGVNRDQIDTVYSHEQAIAQCKKFLRKHFPNAQYIPTRSTAESLKKLDGHSAGIVGSHVQADGVVLSEENIADETRNFTRFLRVVRSEEYVVRPCNKIFFCAVCRHEPGMLCQFLSVFATNGVNLTKIESRPVADSFGQYRFFIEAEGDLSNEKITKTLALAEEKCRFFRLIGAY